MIHDNCKEFQNLDKGLIKTRMRQNEHDCRDTQNNMKKGPQWTERHCKMITFRYKATANRNKITAKRHKMTPENQSDYKERDGKEPESNMG